MKNKKILINGISAKSGGGKSILINFIKILMKNTSKNIYYILTPNTEFYSILIKNNPNIKLIYISDFFKNKYILSFTHRFILPFLINKYNINLVFNLSDIPVVTKKFQIFLFDWSYAVYPESKVWEMMSSKDYYVRKLKLFFFKKNLKSIDLVVAQTNAMKDRLESIYKIKKVEVIGNAVSLENLKGEDNFNFNLKNKINLLYLTYYYPHKNLEIFIQLAQIIKKKKLNFNLIITIDSNQNKEAESFLNNIKYKKLDDIIINVGPVDMQNVPSLYKQCDGLLMPTLLESFSGTYVEAMFHEIPIFTSNFDFSKDICRDGAVYFDPFNEYDIIEKLHFIYNNPSEKIKLLSNAKERLNAFSSWEQTFNKFNKLFENNHHVE